MIIRPDIHAMQAYRVADATGMIKLDAMENPYALPDQVRADLMVALAQTITQQGLNRYPNSDASVLKAALRDYFQIPAEYPIMLGNGSDELISLVAQACAVLNDAVPPVMLSPVPTFVMYQVAAQLNHLQFVGVPLRPDFSLDEAAMLAAIALHRPRVVFLAYPNNPTDTLFSADAIQACIDACATIDCLVVMDEAYHAFAPDSWLDIVQGQLPPHVIVMRTVSRLGLAGVRLGYLFGGAEIMAQLEKIRPPYNVNALTQTVVTHLLQKEYNLGGSDVFALQTASLLSERQRMQGTLAGLQGIKVIPSAANFLTFSVEVPRLELEEPQCSATYVFDALRVRGILIKNLSHAHPLLAQHLRVSIGTPTENDAFLEALIDIMASAITAISTIAIPTIALSASSH